MKKQITVNFKKVLFVVMLLVVGLGSTISSFTGQTVKGADVPVTVTVDKDSIGPLTTVIVTAQLNPEMLPNLINDTIVFTVPEEFNIGKMVNNDVFACSITKLDVPQQVSCVFTDQAKQDFYDGNLNLADVELELSLTSKVEITDPIDTIVTVEVGGESGSVGIHIEPGASNPQPIAKSTEGSIQAPGVVSNGNGGFIDGWSTGGTGLDGVPNDNQNFPFHIWLNQPGNPAVAAGTMNSGVSSFSDQMGSNLAFVGADVNAPETAFVFKSLTTDLPLNKVTDCSLVTAGSNNYCVVATTTNSFELKFDFDNQQQYYMEYNVKELVPGSPQTADDITNNNKAVFNANMTDEYETTIYVFEESDVTGDFAGLKKSATVIPAVKTGKLVVNKTDDAGNILPGVTFSVTGPNGFSQNITTDANGQATLTNLAVGDYTVTEISAPAGYVVDSTPQTMAVTTVEQQAGIVAPGDVIHYKLEVDTRSFAYGAGTKLVDTLPAGVTLVPGSGTVSYPANYPATINGGAANAITSTPVTTFVQNPTSIELTYTDALPNNGYIVAEFDVTVNAGLADGAVINNLFRFGSNKSNVEHRVIDVTGAQEPVTTFNFINARGTGLGEIVKTNVLGDPLEGAVFSITGTSSTGETVNMTGLTTDATGKIVTPTALLEGTYTVTETAAPAGYALAEPQEITIKNGETVSITIVDELTTGNLVIKKVDIANGDVLAGAEFSIVGTDILGVEVNLTAVSGVDGTISTDLAPGTYTVTETKAPAGYELDSTPQEITIVAGEEGQLEFKDTKIPTPPTPPTEPSGPEIVIEKAVDKSTAISGDELTYTITVANIGDTVATDVKVTDEVDANLMITDGKITKGSGTYTENYVDATIGELAPGEVVQLIITAKVREGVVNTEIPNTAKVSSKETGEKSSNKVITTIPGVKVEGMPEDAILPNTGK